MDPLIPPSMYQSGQDSASPLGSSVKLNQPSGNERFEIDRILSRLAQLERELQRAKNRIRELETRNGLIEQRINSRLG